MDLVPVRFTSKVAPYNAGEVAGFPAEQAEYFIERRVAVPYDPDEPVPDPTTVEGLLWGSVADVMRRVGNTQDRELLVAAWEAERLGEGRRVAMEAISERIFQLRLYFPGTEARDEVAAERDAARRPLDHDDPTPSDTEGLAGMITDVGELVLGLDDVDLLQRLYREELVGRGRAAVLSAIEDRLASLGHSMDDPSAAANGRSDEGSQPVQPRTTKAGGALGRLASGAARRFAPSKAERERRAQQSRAEQEQRRQRSILDQALADGIEIWGVNDRPNDREPGSLH